MNSMTSISICALFILATGGKLQSQQIQWEQIPSPNGIQLYYALTHSSGKIMLYSSGELYAYSHLYIAEPPSTNWELHEPFAVFRHPFIEAQSGAIFTATSEGIVRSIDTGNSWQEVCRMTNPYRIAVRGTAVAGYSLHDDSIAFSSDGGDTWEIYRYGLTTMVYPGELFIDDQLRLYTNTYYNGLLRFDPSKGALASWDTVLISQYSIYSAWQTAHGDILIAIADSGILRSTDQGKSWEMTVETRQEEPGTFFRVQPMDNQGGLLGIRYIHGRKWNQVYSLTQSMVRYSAEASDWIEIPQPPGSGPTGYVIATGGLIYNSMGRVYHSTDTGVTWTDMTGNIRSLEQCAIHPMANGEFLLASRFWSYVSTQNRMNWKPLSTIATDAATAADGGVYMVTSSGVAKSLDNGNWVDNLTIPGHIEEVRDIACDDEGNVYLCTSAHNYDDPDTVYVSTNHGLQWDAYTVFDFPVLSMLYSPKKTLFMATHSHIYWRRDGEPDFQSVIRNDILASWYDPVHITRDDKYIAVYARSILLFDTKSRKAEIRPYENPAAGSWFPRTMTQDAMGTYYMSDYTDVYRSDSVWGPWESCSDGMEKRFVYDLYYDDVEHRLYAATLNGIYRTSEPVVKVELHETSSPFSLAPAFPNPFTGSTTITYSLPSQGYITLEVYNTLGQNVRTLYNGLCEPGEHTARFTAAGLPGGMYRVLLRNGDEAKCEIAIVR